MSNCIDVRDRYRLNKQEFDIDGFIEESKKFKKTEVKWDSDDFYWYWFLNGAFELDGDTIIFSFGQNCRSSHTWRDFKGLLKYLRKWFKTKTFSMVLKDIDSGADQYSRCTWDFEKEDFIY